VILDFRFWILDCRAGGSGPPGSPAVFDSGLAVKKAADGRTTRPTLFNPKSKIKNPKSFTLIELLVVVAIIAVLMAILLPALAQARDQARMLLCGTRLNQMYKACAQYGNDYLGWQPEKVIWRNPPVSPIYRERWNWTLVGLGYLPNTVLPTNPPNTSGWAYNSDYLYCPSQKITIGTFTFGSCYGRNYHFGQSIQLEKVNQPTRKLFIGDTADGDAGFVLGNPYGMVWEWAQDGIIDRWGSRFDGCHRGVRANIVFADGHVGSYSSREKPSWQFLGYWKTCPEDWDPFF